MTQKILLIEDDDTVREYIVKGLTENGYVVDWAKDGRDGLYLGAGGGYVAIVLDRMLPSMDGLAVLAALRAGGIHTPIIILSALSSTDERVRGLKAGSDDYLIKPFSMAELLARIDAVCRRSLAKGDDPVTQLSCGDLVMELLSRRIERAGSRIDVKPREFRLLEYLLRNQGRVVTRTMMLEQVWGYHFDPGSNIIDVHISRLRKKIEGKGEYPLLHTIRGAGYMLGEIT